MRCISLEELIQALQEQGLDHTYQALERLFLEEPLIVIDKEGHVIRSFFDEEEMFEYLENLHNTMMDVEEEEL